MANRAAFKAVENQYVKTQEGADHYKKLWYKLGFCNVEEPVNAISLLPWSWRSPVWLHIFGPNGPIQPGPKLCPIKHFKSKTCEICETFTMWKNPKTGKTQKIQNKPGYFYPCIYFLPEAYGVVVRIEGKKVALNPVKVFLVPAGTGNCNGKRLAELAENKKYKSSVLQFSRVGGKKFEMTVLSDEAKAKLPNKGKVPDEIREKHNLTEDEAIAHILNCFACDNFEHFGVEAPPPPPDYEASDGEEYADEDVKGEESKDAKPKKKKAKFKVETDDEEAEEEEEEEEDEEEEVEEPPKKKLKKKVKAAEPAPTPAKKKKKVVEPEPEEEEEEDEDEEEEEESEEDDGDEDEEEDGEDEEEGSEEVDDEPDEEEEEEEEPEPPPKKKKAKAAEPAPPPKKKKKVA